MNEVIGMVEDMFVENCAAELQLAAGHALDVQFACNLSGVVHSFSRVMSSLCKIKPDTDWRNRHPIAVLFATQIASLTRVAAIADDACEYDRAYEWCSRVSKSREEAVKEVRKAMGLR